MLNVIDSILLGAVQGATEFLPISSSGHLILARQLLGINTESGLAFDAILQLGTVIAALAYFRRDIIQLVYTFWCVVTRNTKKTTPEDRILLLGIILGTIPALCLGLVLEESMETIFRSTTLVACTLIAGSLLFVAAESRAKKTPDPLTLKKAWWIGLFQSLALVPGVSRSGATISGGLLLGLSREAATRFSFLLSLPIITGSGLLQWSKILEYPSSDFRLSHLAIGFIVSAVVGYISIRWLLSYLKTHSLMAFVWYRLALAAVILTIGFFT